MELTSKSINDVLVKELSNVSLNKNNLTKHRFKNDNDYKVRTISLTIDNETKDEDFKRHMSDIMNQLFIDDISTTFVTGKQRYSKKDVAKVLSPFNKFEFENGFLMYHLTPIYKQSHKSMYKGEPLNLNEEMLEKFKSGEISKEDIKLSNEFVVSDKPNEITLVLSIMYCNN